MASTIVAILGDTHCGSSTAISPAKFTINSKRPKEQQTVTCNSEQKWLLKCWGDYWDHVKSRVGIRGKFRKNRLIIIHLGDAVDGNHHASRQLIPDPVDQINAAVELLKVPTKIADKTYITYGTDVHNGGNGEYEINLATELGNTVFHDYYFSLNMDGVTFDIGHHGRAGRRDWTTSAAAYAVEIALEYFKDGMEPPKYVLRGHNHSIDDSGVRVPYTRAIACPSWQLRTSFGFKVKAGRSHSDIGALLLDTKEPDFMEFSRARYSAPQEQRVYSIV